VSNTKQYDNYADLITFTRASTGTALRHVGYGAELVTNGTFNTDSNWTLSSNVTISGGALNFNAVDTSFIGASQSFLGVAGKVYEVKIDVTSISSGDWQVFIDRAADLTLMFGSTTGSFKARFVADGTETNIFVARRPVTQLIGSLDNVSVKEVIFDRATDPLVLFNHPTNVPRIEYDASGNRKGLLIEEARTNFVPFSETFSASAGNTLIPNDRIAPDGNLTATNVTANNSANIGVTTFATTGAIASNTYTISVWVYAETTFNFTIRSRGNGTVTEAQNTSVSTVAGQWVRVSSTHTFTAAADGSNVAVFVYTGEINVVNSNTIWLWGFQLEAGSFPTSYISTAGAAASRSADVASIPTSAFGYNADKGTVVVDFEVSNYVSGSRRLFSLNTNSQNRVDGLLVSNGQFQQFVVVGNVGQVSENSGNSITNNEPSKAAAVYALNDFASVLDGGAVQTDTSGTVPSVNTLSIGTSPVNNWTNGYLKSIQYYPRRLTNAQLQELTS
jgi:hypothetical protein